MKGYFERLKTRNIDDQKLYDAIYNTISFGAVLGQIILLPIALFGAIHCGLFYFAIKVFVETKFKRPVFWGSTKLVMMLVILGNLNLFLFFLLPQCVGVWGTIIYFLFIPFSGLIFHNWLSFIKRKVSHKNFSTMNVSDILEERLILKEKISNLIST